MSELVPVSPVVEPPPPGVASATPIPVLAEGTAPVAIRYPTGTEPRRVWPWLVGAAVLASAAAVAYTTHTRREARAELEARYPIVATPREANELANGAARWENGKRRLLATLATFDAPDLATLKGVGACPLDAARSADELARATVSSDGETPAWDDRDLDLSTRHMILPGETFGDLAALARPELEHLRAAATRGRFQTVAGRDHVLHTLGGAFVVVRVDELRLPELDRAHDTVAPGFLTGTAYAFDPATGTLRCAGTVRAGSSSAVTSLSSFSGLDQAYAAAIREFAAQVETSIVTSLRAVD